MQDQDHINKTKNKFLGVGYVLVFIFVMLLAGVLIIGQLSGTNTLKAKAAGTYVGKQVFCGGKELCDDGKCTGSTWKECGQCPLGKAKAVMKMSCDENLYSECLLDAENCIDSN